MSRDWILRPTTTVLRKPPGEDRYMPVRCLADQSCHGCKRTSPRFKMWRDRRGNFQCTTCVKADVAAAMQLFRLEQRLERRVCITAEDFADWQPDLKATK